MTIPKFAIEMAVVEGQVGRDLVLSMHDSSSVIKERVLSHLNYHRIFDSGFMADQRMLDKIKVMIEEFLFRAEWDGKLYYHKGLWQWRENENTL